jgi:hypothetical protein
MSFTGWGETLRAVVRARERERERMLILGIDPRCAKLQECKSAYTQYTHR